MVKRSIDMNGSETLYVLAENFEGGKYVVFFQLNDALEYVLEIVEGGGTMKACKIRAIDITTHGDLVDLQHEMLAYLIQKRHE